MALLIALVLTLVFGGLFVSSTMHFSFFLFFTNIPYHWDYAGHQKNNPLLPQQLPNQPPPPPEEGDNTAQAAGARARATELAAGWQVTSSGPANKAM